VKRRFRAEGFRADRGKTHEHSVPQTTPPPQKKPTPKKKKKNPHDDLRGEESRGARSYVGGRERRIRSKARVIFNPYQYRRDKVTERRSTAKGYGELHQR